MTHQIVSHEEWLKARKAFLEKEKAFTKAREDLARERLHARMAALAGDKQQKGLGVLDVSALEGVGRAFEEGRHVGGERHLDGRDDARLLHNGGALGVGREAHLAAREGRVVAGA